MQLMPHPLSVNWVKRPSMSSPKRRGQSRKGTCRSARGPIRLPAWFIVTSSAVAVGVAAWIGATSDHPVHHSAPAPSAVTVSSETSEVDHPYVDPPLDASQQAFATGLRCGIEIPHCEPVTSHPKTKGKGKGGQSEDSTTVRQSTSSDGAHSTSVTTSHDGTTDTVTTRTTAKGKTTVTHTQTVKR